MLKKLRIRFIVIMMFIVTMMLIIIFGLVLNLTSRRLRDENIRMMSMMLSAPARGPRPDDHPEDGKNIRLPFFRLELDEAGNILNKSGDYYDLTDEESLSDLAVLAMKSEKKVGTLSQYSLRFMVDDGTNSAWHRNDDLKAAQASQSDDADQASEKSDELTTDGQSTPATVIVFSDISSEISTMQSLLRNCILIGLLAFFSFLLISILFARWAVKPVEDSWNQQRQFVSDASHELKTPLTVILTNAELLKSSQSRSMPFGMDVKEQTEWLEAKEKNNTRFTDNILTMSHQMRGLVESLLELARVDNGALQKMTPEHVNFTELVRNELLTFEAVFYERDLKLTDELTEGLSVNGSAAHLRQVIEILLDNAQKYCDPKGEVHVELKKKDIHHLLFSVSDPGAPISEEDRKNIFKRFYRGDQARTMNHSYGLGLAIAENIVLQHKGRIWAESAVGINTFCVELPIH